MNSWFYGLIPFAVVAFWCALCGLISLAGWAQLSREFRAVQKPDGPLHVMQRLRIGGANYNGILTIGYLPQGLYLAVFPLFGIGHAPLLIPWDKMSALRAERWFWFDVLTTKVETGRFGRVSLVFLDRDAMKAAKQFLPLAG